jgi:hypothetical protein
MFAQFEEKLELMLMTFPRCEARFHGRTKVNVHIRWQKSGQRSRQALERKSNVQFRVLMLE